MTPHNMCTSYRMLMAALACAMALGWWPPFALAAGESTPSQAEAQAAGPNVYAAGSDVRPDAAVRGDFMAVGGRVVVDQPVAGDANLAGGSVDLRAAVADDVRAVGGEVRIDAPVGGDLVASGGHLVVAQGGSVGRAANLYGGNVLVQGRIDGQLKAIAGKIVAPQSGATMAERIQATPWLALGAGLGVVLAVPTLAVLLIITLLGLPLGVALMALFPALVLTGFLVGVLFLSRRLALALRQGPPDSLAGRAGMFALTLLIVLLAMRLPFVGPLAASALALAGLGACVLAFNDWRKSRAASEHSASNEQPPAPAGA